MIPTIKDVWWLMFHVARRAYFVCRDVMRVIVTGVGGGWMVTLGGFCWTTFVWTLFDLCWTTFVWTLLDLRCTTVVWTVLDFRWMTVAWT